MPKIKILVADEIDISGIRFLSKSKFTVTCKFGISNEDILRLYKDYDVLVIRSIRKIDSKFLDDSFFKTIVTCSKGTDHIDKSYAEKKGITVLNADDSNNISAAEHTIGLILAIHKNILLSDSLVRNNKFTFYNYERSELHGKKIGIIGFGKVGSLVGKLSKAFGMTVFANDTDRKVKLKNKDIVFKSCDYILKNCDIVSIHIPLENNFHFISKEKLNLINKDSVLINTSRGDVIDEKHLLKMLKGKRIKSAGIDVFSHEPDIDKDFASLDNVILTNHIAGKTIQSRRKISDNVFRQIKNLFG